MSSEERNSQRSQRVSVSTDAVRLEGNLTIPNEALGVVLFAHGSGSSRHSPRNQAVAETLQAGGLATLLIDLLTTEEELVDRRTRHLRFDIELLTRRLAGAIDWLADQPATGQLNIGLFGSSTGAAAALMAASHRPHAVQAVVSRGGRPDLAAPRLAQVQAPTLLIVGGQDTQVIDLNKQALAQLEVAEKSLEIVPRAGHLFEEPGALEAVSRLAREWFRRCLGRPD